jgi:hypothetical protein
MGTRRGPPFDAMRIKFHYYGRKELFSMRNDYSHSPRPVVVNRAFHAFARGETMDFPDLYSPCQRRTEWVIDKLARACFSLLTRWLEAEEALVDLPVNKIHAQSAVSREGNTRERIFVYDQIVGNDLRSHSQS